MAESASRREDTAAYQARLKWIGWGYPRTMNVYRWLWRVVWLVISVVPVGLGVLEASPVALFCLGSVVSVVVAATGRPTKTWFASGLLGAAVVAGLWSTGEAGVGLFVVACATAPPVVARACALVRRSRRQSAQPSSEMDDVDAVSVLSADLWAGPVHALEDQQLFRSWSESFVALKLARTIDERLELVNLRQAYLDELESRNATGFDSWLRSRARPVGSPHLYFEARDVHLETPSSPTAGDLRQEET